MKTFPALLLILLFCNPAMSQWKNRYPKVDGYGHHVYMEAFELPVMNSGITDPAPSPDGRKVAFASKGWIWVLDLGNGVATQLTSGLAIDARPNWSPDGTKLVFVRDDSENTSIVGLDPATNQEEILIDSEKIELDPVFSRDGSTVYYSSSENGTFDLWKLDIASGQKQALTSQRALERLPVPAGDDQLVYLRKQGFSYDNIELLTLTTGETKILVADNFAAQGAFSLAPDNRTLVYTWPHVNNYELKLLDLETPQVPVVLTGSDGLPLMPKFSADGQWIYYSEYNQSEQAELKRISVNGGYPEKLHVREWTWKEPMKLMKIITRKNDQQVAARLSVTVNGHPFVPEQGTIHSEGQNGNVFFYSPGEIELLVPLGTARILASAGFESPATEETLVIDEMMAAIDIDFTTLWDAGENGWFAGDNHFHLNYGGTNRLSPEDLLPELRGEGIDVAFPLVANLHNRYLDEALFGWKNTEVPLVQFGQEVRSHFLGHINLVGTDSLFWPWIWGPSYNVYGRDDRTNAEAVAFARRHGGLGGYVHPVGNQQPFTEAGARGVPVELVADCVLGECDMIEVACLWTDEIGTAAVWHELLSLGIPVALSAGSDVMSDYYRTMAIGSTRLYAKPDGELSVSSYLEALKDGKSFVTNGPLLDLKVEGISPGGAVLSGNRRINWTLDVHSPVKPETIEIFVNGDVVWSRPWNNGPGTESFNGSLEIPAGGWITARVSGGDSAWPMLDSYPFAETSPVWIGEKGSTDAARKVKAAKNLLLVLGVSEGRLKQGYGETPIPNLESQFDKARKLLESISGN